MKYILDEASLKLLYLTLIVPYLTYCTEVWGNACTSYTERLCLLQKKAIRIVTHKGGRDHTNKLFIKLQTLKFYDLVKLKILQIMWRVKNNMVPIHIQNKFKLIIDSKNRRKGNFCVPYSRTSKKQKGFMVIGISLWNSLDNEERSCYTIVQFKKIYIKKVFRKYEESEK